MLSDLFKSMAFILPVAKLALAADVIDISSDGHGCTATIASSSIGFNANFYSYSLTNLSNFNDNNWIANSFTDYSLFASAPGVTDPNFTFPATSATNASLYGLDSLDLKYTLLELTGYFIAAESGVYQISVNSVDNSVWFWLGSNAAFDCCSHTSTTSSENDILLGVSTNGTYSSFVYLDKDVMYPMKIKYINYALGSSLDFSIVTPSDEIITKFNNAVVNFDIEDITNCDKIRGTKNLYLASPTFAADFATAYPTLNAYAYIPSTFTTIFTHFETIKVRDINIITYAYSGEATITSTLVYTYDIMGIPFTTTETALLLPETTLGTWTGITTLTSVVITSAIGTDGIPTITTYKMVEVPSTTYKPSTSYFYSGDISMTSTLTYPSTDSYGATTTITEIAVLMPITTLFTWTGSYTTAGGIGLIATAVNAEGIPIKTTFWMVAVPYPPTASDTYAYTGGSTITSMFVYTTADAFGKISTTTDVALLVPQNTLATWTGSYTTSVVITTSAIDADGLPALTTYTIVEVPSASDTYEYTGGSTITSTLVYTVADEFGKISTTTDVAILVPKNTLANWTGSYTTSVVITTTAIDADGLPALTTYTMVEIPFTPSDEYFYTGNSIITTTLAYPSTNAHGVVTTITDVAVLWPIPSIVTWDRSYTSTAVFFGSEVADGIPFETAFLALAVPSPTTASQTYAYTGEGTIISTLIYSTVDGDGNPTTVTDIAFLEPEITSITWTGLTPTTSVFTTSAIDADGKPVLSTYNVVNVPTPTTALDFYVYTGEDTITTTLVYTSTDIGGKETTITDIAVLYPETTLLTVPGIFHTFTVIFSAIGADGKPTLSTYDMVIIPSATTASNTYAYSGEDTTTTTLIYSTLDGNGSPIVVTDIAVLEPEITSITWTGLTSTVSTVTTSAIDATGRPVLTIYNMVEVPSSTAATSASHTYAYTGEGALTSTLIYSTVDVRGNPITVTDVAALEPVTLLSTWTGSFITSAIITTTAIGANGKLILTTYTMLEIPVNTVSTTGVSSATGVSSTTEVTSTTGVASITEISSSVTTSSTTEISSNTGVSSTIDVSSTAAVTSTTDVLSRTGVSSTTGVWPTTDVSSTSGVSYTTEVSSTTELSSISTSIIAPHTYEYTGTSIITTTLVYTTTDVGGNPTTVTDIALLKPNTTINKWTGSFTTSVIVTATAIDANGRLILTTYTMVELPLSEVSTSVWSNSFSSTIVTTVGTIITNIVCIPSSTAASNFTEATNTRKTVYDTIIWSNSYTSTIITTLETNIVTIVCIPSSTSFAIIQTPTACNQCETSVWLESSTSTATITIPGAVSTVVYVSALASTFSNQNALDKSSNKLSDFTQRTSIIFTSSETTGTIVDTGTTGTTGATDATVVIGTTGTLLEATIATFNTSTTNTNIANESTTMTAPTVSSYQTSQPLVTVYEASSYRLKHSLVIALIAYMLAI